jgi:hypothetical protein
VKNRDRKTERQRDFLTGFFSLKVFSTLEVIEMLLKISKRCFSKVIVAAMFDSENPKLSETEKVYLIGLLQLMESAYDENIWNNLAVVTFENEGNLKPNLT